MFVTFKSQWLLGGRCSWNERSRFTNPIPSSWWLEWNERVVSVVWVHDDGCVFKVVPPNDPFNGGPGGILHSLYSPLCLCVWVAKTGHDAFSLSYTCRSSRTCLGIPYFHTSDCLSSGTWCMSATLKQLARFIISWGGWLYGKSDLFNPIIKDTNEAFHVHHFSSIFPHTEPCS